MNRRLLAIILASSMTALTITGCGSQSDGSTGETSQTADSAATVEQDTVAAATDSTVNDHILYQPTFTASGTNANEYTAHMELYEKELTDYLKETNQLEKVEGYDTPITVKTVMYYTAAMQDSMAAFKDRYGETMEYNRWFDITKRYLNVDMKLEWSALTDDYDNTLRLDMSAGELPDIFIVRNQSDLISMAKNGLIWDLTDLIPEYATQHDTDALQSDNQAGLQMASYDGKVYGLPAMLSATDAVSYIWIRNDWMQKLGLKEPTTMDELQDVMKAFVTQDPDGNGMDDTWGIIPDKDLDYNIRGVFSSFDSYPYSWYLDGNSVVYGGTTETTKNALSYLHDCYEKGYIDPEFATLGNDEILEQVYNDKVGIIYGGHWFGHNAQSHHDLNPEADWKCIELPTGTGSAVRNIIFPQNGGWVVVNKNFEHPEIAFKMRSLVCNVPDASSEGDWWWFENSNAWNFSPIRNVVSSYDNLNTYLNLMEVYKNNEDTSLLRGKAITYWANLHGKDKYAWELMFGPGEGTPMSILNQDYQNGQLFWDAFHGSQSSTMQNMWSTIQDEQKRIYTDIIVGNINADDGFKQWLDTFNSLSGEQITKEVNDWYNEYGTLTFDLGSNGES